MIRIEEIDLELTAGEFARMIATAAGMVAGIATALWGIKALLCLWI